MTTSPPPAGRERVRASFADWDRRLAAVEQQLAQAAGAYAALPCTSATHPASPRTGTQILETDTGLSAWWNGAAWIYPPQLLAAVVVGTAAASVRLPASGSLPQVFKNLRVLVSAQSSGGGTNGFDSASVQINGVTGATYSWNSVYGLQGAGAGAVASGSLVTSAQCMEVWNSHFTTAARGTSVLDFPNYSDTTCLKSFTGQSAAADGGTAGILQTYSGVLGGAGNTGALGYLTFLMGSGNFLTGSAFYAYGS